MIFDVVDDARPTVEFWLPDTNQRPRAEHIFLRSIIDMYVLYVICIYEWIICITTYGMARRLGTAECFYESAHTHALQPGVPWALADVRRALAFCKPSTFRCPRVLNT